MQEEILAYKRFKINGVEVSALGDLDGSLGDELRAFKRKEIDYPKEIIDKFVEYYKYKNIKSDILLYVPSNANSEAMKFFAETLSEKLKIKKLDSVFFNWVSKKGKYKEQKYLETLEARESNVKGAFIIMNPFELRDKNILLIDDVYASGATLREVLKSLNENNIFDIECIVFCHRNRIFL